MAAFAERVDRPVVTSLREDDAPKFMAIDQLVVVGSFSPKHQALREYFDEIAESHRDRYSFGVVDRPNGDHLSAKNEIICRNNVEDTEYKTEDLERIGSLEQTLEACAAPLVMPLTRRNELVFHKV